MGWKQHVTGAAVAAAVALALPGALVAAQQQEPSAHGARPASDEVSKFYKKAAMGNLAEIELGKLGAEKAQDPQVKQYAQQMVEAHQRALDKLKETASGNVDWPATLDEKHQKLHDKLSAMSGEQFDIAYVNAMVDAHESMEGLLKDWVGESGKSTFDPTTGATGTSGTAASPRLSGATHDWATQALQDVRSHLEQAKELKEHVGK